MQNTNPLFKVNIATYFLILTFLFTGLIKNIIIIYIIILFHELGHILIIKFLKYQIIKIDIYPMGGLTSINKPINTSFKDDLLIALFGPLFQVLLIIIFLIFLKLNIISFNTYNLFINYNKTILIFNLLPIIPLDGFKILRTLIETIFPFKKSFYLSLIVNLLFIALFITYNTLFSLNNYLVISFLIFKIITTYQEFKNENFKFQLERYLYDFKFSKIKQENKPNLDLLKKGTYHYFKMPNTIISEKKLLSEKFL